MLAANQQLAEGRGALTPGNSSWQPGVQTVHISHVGHTSCKFLGMSNISDGSWAVLGADLLMSVWTLATGLTVRLQHTALLVAAAMLI